MARLAAVAAVLSTLLVSCSLIYDQDRYDPPCSNDADCTSIDPLFVCDEPTERCIPCDRDGDGYPGGDARCVDVIATRTVDCDDTDPGRAPGNAPLCGDGRAQTCPDPTFTVVEMLTDAMVEESGPLRLRVAADPGLRIHTFDVGAYPPTDQLDGADAVVAYTFGEPGARGAQLVELDLDGDYRSREVDPATVRSADADFEAMADIEDVQLRTLLVPAERGFEPGVGFAMLGTDVAGRSRIGGGSVSSTDAGPLYAPFASLPRDADVYGNLVLTQFSAGFLPAAVWREPGGTLVRATSIGIEGVDPLRIISAPGIVPEGRARMHGTFGALVLGETGDGRLFWWDLVSPTVGTGMLGPSTGRVAVGLADESGPDVMSGALGTFLIAYPRDTQIIHQLLVCPTPDQADCTLSGETPTDVRVRTSLFDMDLFALATVHETTGGIQTVSLRILGMGPTVALPLVTSAEVNGRIEDVRVSISFADDVGLNLILALLVTPEGDESRHVVWTTGARLCGSQGPMMPMDGGMPPPDAGPPPSDAGTEDGGSPGDAGPDAAAEDAGVDAA